MRISVAVVAGTLLVASCSSGGKVPIEAAEDAVAPTVEAIQAKAAFEPGGLGEGRLEVDGRTVDYVTITPAEFEVGDGAPVLVAFPPGGQDLGLTRSFAEQTYLREAIERGWVVFSPAAPVGEPLWYDGSQPLIPAILDWLETWVDPEGGTVHVAGVSNGGLSTFAVAALVPDRVQSLLVFPGYPRSSEASAALPDLVEVPVRMEPVARSTSHRAVGMIRCG